MTILCVGNDANILTSRASVLRRTGAQVIVTPPDAALTIIANDSVDLVVVCYSVSQSASLRVYEAAKTRTPAAFVLQLTPICGYKSGAKKHSDVVAGTDPAMLVRTAAQLLKEQQSLVEFFRD